MNSLVNGYVEGLKARGVSLTLCVPDVESGYYRGTRFDWAGIIRSLSFKGHEYVDEWFDNYDPAHHDCVCGPVEEFTQIGYEDALAGGAFLKIGVGMLRKPVEEKYDRFNVYEISDPGERSFSIDSERGSAVFRHLLKSGLGYEYDYVKEVSIKAQGVLELSHTLKNTGPLPLSGSVYDHNFFTLDSMRVGPATLIDFPFKPEGDWRQSYDNVALTGSGIRFSKELVKGDSVFMGNLHPGNKGEDSLSGHFPGYSFRLFNASSGAGIEAKCESPFDFMVFWSNHRVSCLEPYIPFCVQPGGSFSWTIVYKMLSV